MNCCPHLQGLNEVFNDAEARRGLKAYWKKGLHGSTRALVEAAAATGQRRLEGATVLEVGGGVGAVHAALLQRGAAHASDVDASAAYVRAAQQVAERLGLRERVEYHQGDFVQLAGEVPPADVVVMHRVVCCYPAAAPLVRAAAEKARWRLVISYPRAAWYMRLGVAVVNLGLRLWRNPFRTFVHDPRLIRATAEAAGLRLRQRRTAFPWEIVVFERAAD